MPREEGLAALQAAKIVKMLLYVQSFPILTLEIPHLAMPEKPLFFKKGHWKIKFVPYQ